jgi:hypothetical protein
MATALKITDFMDKLRQDLIDNKGVSDTSANLYIGNLYRLNDKVAFNNLGFLKKTNIIMEKISELGDKTQQTYLASIVSCLHSSKDKHLYKTTFKFYAEKLKEKGVENDLINPNEKTEKEIDNWLTWEQVLEKQKGLEDKVKVFSSNKSITKSQYETLLEYVVLSLYVLQSPRRNLDYLAMTIVKSMPKDQDKNKNYLDVENKQFVFNTYKTAKSHGQKVEDINDALWSVISTYLKYHPCLAVGGRKPSECKFLVNEQGTPLVQVNAITRILNRALNAKVASSMLRHIYITSKFGKDFEMMDEVADEMGHSVAQQRQYYKKE